MSKLRVAFIGTGPNPDKPGAMGYAMAYRHADAYRTLPDIEFVAAADIKPENGQAFCAKYNVPEFFTDYNAMLAATQRLVEAGPRREEIDRARALVRQAEAVLADARRRLADTRLASPVSGTVQVRVHEAGDFVNAGEPVFSIALQDEVWVRTYVAERDLEAVRPGMAVEVRTDGGNRFSGRVGFVSSVAEFTPKTVETRDVRTQLVYRVRILVKDSEGRLRQGMPVTVRLSPESPGSASGEEGRP